MGRNAKQYAAADSHWKKETTMGFESDSNDKQNMKGIYEKIYGKGDQEGGDSALSLPKDLL